MTTRRNANGEGTVYQRKDGRWVAAAYILGPAALGAASASTPKRDVGHWPNWRRRPLPAARACPPARTGYVFTTSLGAPLDPQEVTHGIKTLCDRAGVRRIRFHDLRHTCATLLIETGVPLVTVKELLGHSNITITANISTHTRLPHQADTLSRLDTRLDQTPRRTRRPTSAHTPNDRAEHDKD